ncbi:hypothetical protein YC2023_004655 [Brassica napus]
MLHIPEPESRAVKAGFFPYSDLPDLSCRKTKTCPLTMLLTGNNQSLGKALSGTMFGGSFTVNTSDLLPSLADNVLRSTRGRTIDRCASSADDRYQEMPPQMKINIDRCTQVPSIDVETSDT